MIDPNATINFNGCDISLQNEYHEARKMMGLKTTDLDKLHTTVAHIYICIPKEHDGWAQQYLALMDEIQWRQNMLIGMKLDKLTA